MNRKRLEDLCATARAVPAPEVAEKFSQRVMAQVRCEPFRTGATMRDELDQLYPRLVWTALLVMALCLALDQGHAAIIGPDLADGATQWLEQWLVAGL